MAEKWMDFKRPDGYAADDKDAEIKDLKNHIKFAWGFAIYVLIVALLSC